MTIFVHNSSQLFYLFSVYLVILTFSPSFLLAGEDGPALHQELKDLEKQASPEFLSQFIYLGFDPDKKDEVAKSEETADLEGPGEGEEIQLGSKENYQENSQEEPQETSPIDHQDEVQTRNAAPIRTEEIKDEIKEEMKKEMKKDAREEREEINLERSQPEIQPEFQVEEASTSWPTDEIYSGQNSPPPQNAPQDVSESLKNPTKPKELRAKRKRSRTPLEF